MWVDSSMRQIDRIRAAGIPSDEIYHCGFAHQPGWLSVDEQVARARRVGLGHLFFFLPTLGWVDPRPGLFRQHPGLRHFPTKNPLSGSGWELYLERRRDILNAVDRLRPWQAGPGGQVR